LGTYCYSGTQFGTVVMLSVSGYLASSSLGWPSIFYISGSAGIVWTIFWFFFGGDSPSNYEHISAEERDFIETSLGNTQEEHHKMPTPWKSIFTSLPMISLIVVHSSHNWVRSTYR
jgi:sugar phosphate permease